MENGKTDSPAVNPSALQPLVALSARDRDDDKRRDILRETWMRYLGYANEVGEACRGVLPLSVVHASYGLVGLYVLADTIHKGRQASQSEHDSVRERRFDIVDKVADTLIWQMLASLVVPPLIINRACKLTALGLGKLLPPAIYPAFTPRRRALVQTAVGLSIIPVIVQPIDHGVHVILDHSTRALFHYLRSRYFSTPPPPGVEH